MCVCVEISMENVMCGWQLWPSAPALDYHRRPILAVQAAQQGWYACMNTDMHTYIFGSYLGLHMWQRRYVYAKTRAPPLLLPLLRGHVALEAAWRCGCSEAYRIHEHRSVLRIFGDCLVCGTYQSAWGIHAFHAKRWRRRRMWEPTSWCLETCHVINVCWFTCKHTIL